MIDFLIVGAGPSGVSAAITFKRKNPSKSVLIIEKEEEMLKKLSISGNGKGNFTNFNLSNKEYNNQEFVKEVFSSNPFKDIIEFYKSLGLDYYKDIEGRCYPLSNNAKTISYVLTREIKKLNINYHLNEKALKIAKEKDLFNIKTDKSDYSAKFLMIATGGKNYSTLGSDGSLFKEIERNGHRFTSMYPSNIYILVDNTDVCKKLSGLRFNAKLSLMNDKKLIYSESGELLIKDNGLSGIVTFNLSNELAHLYKNNMLRDAQVLVDFLESYDKKTLEDYLKEKNEKEALLGLLNDKLVDVIVKSSRSTVELVNNIKSFPFKVKSLGDFDHAQMTVGGLELSQISTNLESKVIRNMFFGGDILDIDAKSGGYNLSFAVLSGIKIGEYL